MNGLKHVIILLSLLSATFNTKAQEPVAYVLYTVDGEQATFEDVLKASRQSDVVYFGELHNNPIDHWLQFELLRALNASDSVILAAEMFETDDQVVLNEFLAGTIRQDHLEKEAKLWPNYETDYAPMVDYAKDNHLLVIASNVPRRYASLMAREGADALLGLDEESKSYLPELPFEITANDPGYEEMRTMMSGGHGMGLDPENFVAAQALKDYTMATHIMRVWSDGVIVLHLNGSFHSKNKAGICNYVNQMNAEVEQLVIASVESEDMSFQEEWEGLGDFILVTPAAMTKTH